jgi:hypothetical protein
MTVSPSTDLEVKKWNWHRNHSDITVFHYDYLPGSVQSVSITEQLGTWLRMGLSQASAVQIMCRCSNGLEQLHDGAVTQCAQIYMEWTWDVRTLLASCNIKPTYNYLCCRYSHKACGILHCAELHQSFSELSQVSPTLGSNGSILFELRIMMSLCSSVWHTARYDHCTSYTVVLRNTVPAIDTY